MMTKPALQDVNFEIQGHFLEGTARFPISLSRYRSSSCPSLKFNEEKVRTSVQRTQRILPKIESRPPIMMCRTTIFQISQAGNTWTGSNLLERQSQARTLRSYPPETRAAEYSLNLTELIWRQLGSFSRDNTAPPYQPKRWLFLASFKLNGFHEKWRRLSVWPLTSPNWASILFSSFE